MERDPERAGKNAESHDGDDEQAVTEEGRERWESALGDPEAQAFLKEGIEQRRQHDEQGLIHRP